MPDPEIEYEIMQERIGEWDINDIPECGNEWTSEPESYPIHFHHSCRLPVDHSMSAKCECECGETM